MERSRDRCRVLRWAAEHPLYSTVTGDKVEPEGLDADYWYRNLRRTVRFADAVEQLLSDGIGFLSRSARILC